MPDEKEIEQAKEEAKNIAKQVANKKSDERLYTKEEIDAVKDPYQQDIMRKHNERVLEEGSPRYTTLKSAAKIFTIVLALPFIGAAKGGQAGFNAPGDSALGKATGLFVGTPIGVALGLTAGIAGTTGAAAGTMAAGYVFAEKPVTAILESMNEIVNSLNEGGHLDLLAAAINGIIFAVQGPAAAVAWVDGYNEASKGGQDAIKKFMKEGKGAAAVTKTKDILDNLEDKVGDNIERATQEKNYVEGSTQHTI